MKLATNHVAKNDWSLQLRLLVVVLALAVAVRALVLAISARGNRSVVITADPLVVLLVTHDSVIRAIALLRITVLLNGNGVSTIRSVSPISSLLVVVVIHNNAGLLVVLSPSKRNDSRLDSPSVL